MQCGVEKFAPNQKQCILMQGCGPRLSSSGLYIVIGLLNFICWYPSETWTLTRPHQPQSGHRITFGAQHFWTRRFPTTMVIPPVNAPCMSAFPSPHMKPPCNLSSWWIFLKKIIHHTSRCKCSNSVYDTHVS